MASVVRTIDYNLEEQFNQDIFDYALERGFGEIHIKLDKQLDFRAIIAIHNTKLGPALGGCRFVPYSNSTNAMFDVVRLARAMSYKAAMVNLPYGGGKMVIMKPPHIENRDAFFRVAGQFIESLNGRYITALDSGTNLTDMSVIHTQTNYVSSLAEQDGEPSPYTADGVFNGIRACVKFKYGHSNLSGIHVAIQGVGKVGYYLARLLHNEGAKITVCDIDQTSVNRCVEEFAANVVSSDDIYTVDCDVFAPCALGAVINDQTIATLKAPIIAGSANNQLTRAYHGQRLHENGILYAPDYVINAGGLIYAVNRYEQASPELASKRINEIGSSLLNIFERSKEENLPSSGIADTIAEEKLA